MTTLFSIIIPTLNEAAEIEQTLASLQPLRQQGHQLIVVDGGSTDQTVALCQDQVDVLVNGPCGRACQMNEGAAVANGDWLLFLHADTRLPGNVEELLNHGIASSHRLWGRFDIRLSGASRLLRVVEFMMSWRSRISGIATGDQAIFVRHDIFTEMGGFADLSLMEDVEISKRLKRYSVPLCINSPVVTSSRRWEQHGIIKTVIFMWQCRLLYWLGVSADKLHRRYYAASTDAAIKPSNTVGTQTD